MGLILVYMKTATNMCVQRELNGYSNIFPTVIIKWYMSFMQSTVILILHWIFRKFNTSSTSAFTWWGFKVKQTWNILYSEQLLLAFLENTSTAVFILLGFCSFFDLSILTDIVLNVYYIFLCSISIPTPCRNVIRNII